MKRPITSNPGATPKRANYKRPKSKKISFGFIALPKGISRLRAIVFIAFFAGIGSYLLFKGFAASSPPPPAGGYFSIQPVGSWKSLPSDSSCAAQVHHSAWEPRADNTTANQTVPTGVALRPWPAGSTTADYNTWMLPRVTGNFKGTTDEIIQWAACKWGWPDDVIRAEMVVESNWFQNLKDSQGRTISGSGFGDYSATAADCPAGYTATTPYILSGVIKYGCPRSFGVLQSTWKDGNGPFGNYPAVQDSTAFDIDFTIGTLRACYEGMETWLTQAGPGVYGAGDMWGCIGRWYSGDWHSSAAESYISNVKQKLTDKSWLTWPDQSGSVASTNSQIKFDFEDGTTQAWKVDYGSATTSVSNATLSANTGTHSLAITTHPTAADYPGIAVYSGLSGLVSGSAVTYSLYVPAGSAITNVIPYAYDSSYTFHKSNAVAVVPGWNTITWNIPAINLVSGIGLELENSQAWNGQIFLDTVSWGTASVPADTTPPSQPTSLTASPPSSSQINLNWSASSDNIGITGYDVYRNKTKVATIATNSFSDTNLMASTSYSYYVIARDSVGNASPASNTASATTLATAPATVDTAAPIVSITSPKSAATVSGNVDINATASDNTKVTKLQIYIDGSLKTSNSNANTIAYTWSTRKVRTGSHTITIKAYDAAGNVGQASVTVYR